MRRRRTVQPPLSDSSDDDDEPLSKIANITPKRSKQQSNNNESSSESDIENYLQPANKIDLNSSFFNPQKNDLQSSEKIGNALLATLTDSDETGDESTNDLSQSTSKLNFAQLHEYARKLEEAKRHVEEYNARKRIKENEINVENLLAAGEAKQNDNTKDEEEINYRSSEFESCTDSEKEGWEEVEDKKKEEMPKKDLQITVEMPGPVKKKKGIDLLAAIKRRINRVRKENQILIHKVHLLCWIAHGNYVSSVINSENVLGVALSLLPSKQSYPDGRTDLNYLTAILKWYKSTMVNLEKIPPNNSLDELLTTQIAKKQAYNKNMLVYIFVAIMRSLGIHCRLVLSFVVEPLRPPNSELHSLSTKTESKSKTEAKKPKPRPKTTSSSKSTSKKTDESLAGTSKTNNNRSKSTSTTVEKKKVESSKTNTRSKSVSEAAKPRPKQASSSGSSKTKPESNSSKNKETARQSKSKKEQEKTDGVKKVRSKSTTTLSDNKPKQVSKTKTMKSKNTNEVIEPANKSKRTSTKNEDVKKENTRTLRSQKQTLAVPQLDGANDTPGPSKPDLKKLNQQPPICPNKNHPKRLKAPIKYCDTDSEEDFATTQKNTKTVQKPNLKKLKSPPSKSIDVRADIIEIVKESIKAHKSVSKRKSTNDDDEDSDYAPVEIKKKHHESDDEFSPKIKVKRRVQVKNNEEENTEKAKKQGVDVWVEVFLEAEEKWISVDVVKGELHCVNGLFNRATHPVSYIVAWNNDNRLKDITRRYCTNFNTATRKLRIDAKWWEATLKPFIGPRTVRDKEEDDEFERQHLEKPLPTSISEYKNHPLYVLKRHLLKFEAIYPADAPTLGFVRSEPVYSRQCVYTLHSREIWFKYAKVVKLGEQPYKIVKARPKWDKLSNTVITGQMLEVFGEWQTEDYDPPTAENGIVPRNAFGNVELFKPCMIPKKTVHLCLTGLNKVAKRMNIDCAPAVVGFDFHGGWNHPVYDGFVVCEEFEDILIAAWEIEQDELDKKEREKIDKRVYGNWKRLIKGLLIRERLKVKYEFGDLNSKKKGKVNKKTEN